MKKLTKSYLTRKLDKILSEIVRARGYCVKCGKTETLQAAHIFSRSNRSTRWYLNNVVCFCASCHFWAHKNPVLFTEWVKGFLGDNDYENLKVIANKIKKYSIEDLQELYKEFEKIVMPNP